MQVVSCIKGGILFYSLLYFFRQVHIFFKVNKRSHIFYFILFLNCNGAETQKIKTTVVTYSLLEDKLY